MGRDAEAGCLVNAFAEVADWVLEAHPPGCPDRGEAEYFAKRIVATPDDPEVKAAALRWLDGFEERLTGEPAEAVA